MDFSNTASSPYFSFLPTCTIASMADALEGAGGLREMVLAYVTSPWFRKPADLEND